MARYRKIDLHIWGDENFKALSPIPPCGQGLWFFLLTGPFTGPIPGLFCAGRAAMAEALGWPLKAFDKAFQEASKKGMVKADWEARLVWLPNAIKYNLPESPNVITSWEKELDLLPECQLLHDAISTIRETIYGMGDGFIKAFDKAFGKALPKPNGKTMPNQEQEQEQEQDKERKKESDADASPCLPQDEPKAKRFVKPRVDEVATYCKERRNAIDAQAFVDFYEAVGWKVGNKPMKDWRAAIRTWEHRDPARAPQPARKEKRYRLIGGMNCPICGAPLIAGHTMCDKCSARIDHGLGPTERYYESYEVVV